MAEELGNNCKRIPRLNSISFIPILHRIQFKLRSPRATVQACGASNTSFQNRPIVDRNTLQGKRTLKSETEEIAMENGLRAGGRTESSVFEQGDLRWNFPGT